jgi:hypothetical protein
MNILHVYMLHGYTFIDIYEYHCKISIYLHEHILKFHSGKPYLARSCAGIYLYVCMCIYMYMYIYIFIYIIYLHLYIYVNMYLYIHILIRSHIYV